MLNKLKKTLSKVTGKKKSKPKAIRRRRAAVRGQRRAVHRHGGQGGTGR
jgi:hypothetical protein